MSFALVGARKGVRLRGHGGTVAFSIYLCKTHLSHCVKEDVWRGRVKGETG